MIKNPHYCSRDTQQSVCIPVHAHPYHTLPHTRKQAPTNTFSSLRHIHMSKKKKKKKNPPSSLCHYSMRESHIVGSQPPCPRDQNKLQGGSSNINREWKKYALHKVRAEVSRLRSNVSMTFFSQAKT